MSTDADFFFAGVYLHEFVWYIQYTVYSILHEFVWYIQYTDFFFAGVYLHEFVWYIQYTHTDKYEIFFFEGVYHTNSCFLASCFMFQILMSLPVGYVCCRRLT